MLEHIARWNRWGNATLNCGFLREITTKLISFIDTKEVITLLGARRCGKTTIMFQIMDKLEELGIDQKAVLHINCEEPFFAQRLSIDLLDEIYETFRQKIWPSGKAYIFIDEIQNVAEWERWVRARNESENIKIFITGSSSKLMSRELGTLLTGRHVSMMVYPLNFNEFCLFKDKKIELLDNHEIKHLLDDYLTWGGFPEVVLALDNERKEILLKQYFDDIIFRDISLRHNIRDIFLLRNLAVFLMTQTASLISFNRIANLFGISVEMASNYCHYIEEAFLANLLSHFSLKIAERNRHPKKIHALDTGLRNAIALSFSPDQGRVLESAVLLHLYGLKNNGIFYVNHEQEIDFAVYNGQEIELLVQVCLDFNEPEVQQREIIAFEKASLKFPNAHKMIITKNTLRKPVMLKNIELKSVQEFFLFKL